MFTRAVARFVFYRVWSFFGVVPGVPGGCTSGVVSPVASCGAVRCGTVVFFPTKVVFFVNFYKQVLSNLICVAFEVGLFAAAVWWSVGGRAPLESTNFGDPSSSHF